MFLTVHAATSALIGKKIINPFFSFIVAFIFHFIIDMIPHGDRDYGKRVFDSRFQRFRDEEKFKRMSAYLLIDCIAMVYFLLYLFKNFHWAKDDGVEWAIVGGILPDFLIGFFMVTKSKWLRKFFSFHHKVHYLLVNKMNWDWPLLVGIFMQIVLMTILSLLIYAA